MKNSCVEWYKNSMNSLFGEQTDNWRYQILQEISAMCKLEESEEIIKDTKFRYRVLLDTSLDVFTGDRMENKSYPRYKDNIDFIFQRKHVVEFDVVWIQYLFLKAKNEGKKQNT